MDCNKLQLFGLLLVIGFGLGRSVHSSLGGGKGLPL